MYLGVSGDHQHCQLNVKRGCHIKCPNMGFYSIGVNLWCHILLNSFLASGNFCCQLITIANSSEPEQDRQNVGPDLDPNRLPLEKCSWFFFEKVNFEKSADDNKAWKIKQRAKSRPLVKSVYPKNIFLISQQKHMLWVLKRTVSLRRFFWEPKKHAKTDG